jgi:hypothetical protein
VEDKQDEGHSRCSRFRMRTDWTKRKGRCRRICRRWHCQNQGYMRMYCCTIFPYQGPEGMEMEIEEMEEIEEEIEEMEEIEEAMEMEEIEEAIEEIEEAYWSLALAMALAMALATVEVPGSLRKHR